jgi:hypothetical protein
MTESQKGSSAREKVTTSQSGPSKTSRRPLPQAHPSDPDLKSNTQSLLLGTAHKFQNLIEVLIGRKLERRRADSELFFPQPLTGGCLCKKQLDLFWQKATIIIRARTQLLYVGKVVEKWKIGRVEAISTILFRIWQIAKR